MSRILWITWFWFVRRPLLGIARLLLSLASYVFVDSFVFDFCPPQPLFLTVLAFRFPLLLDVFFS